MEEVNPASIDKACEEGWRNFKIRTRKLTPEEEISFRITLHGIARLAAIEEACNRLADTDHRPLPNYIPTYTTYGAD